MKIPTIVLKILVAVSYVSMVTVNFLANVLPIGGVSTGEASDAYANLFTPAGITFSIWGLIYLLLGGYFVSYCWFSKKSKKELWDWVAKIFILNSLANIAWIFSWHYGQIFLSVLIMLMLLGSLICIADKINRQEFSLSEYITLRLPFSVYFGWITVATIANITVLLVSIGWNGWGISDFVWMIIVTLLGAAIGIARGLKDQNIAYLLVFVWAYGGIWLQHMSDNGYDGQYPAIIGTVIGCMVLFLGTIGWLIFQQKKK